MSPAAVAGVIVGLPAAGLLIGKALAAAVGPWTDQLAALEHAELARAAVYDVPTAETPAVRVLLPAERPFDWAEAR